MKTKVRIESIIWFVGILLLQDVSANFVCPTPGRYLDILSDCERFFFCYENNGVLVYETFKCSHGRLFSVEETRCITASNLQCKELTGATSIPSEVEKIDPIEEFICRGEGIFVNDVDPDCNSFITCTRISGQSYYMNLHYCSSGEKFSHYTFECVPNDQFQCPTEQNETSSNPSTILLHEMSNEPEATSISIHTSESEKVGTTPSATLSRQIDTLVSDPSLTSFECTATGRFPNLDEPGCTTYILCILANGTFFPTINFCDNSFFDPVTRRCSLDYVCPDNTTPMPETTDDEPTTISSDIPEGFECPRSGRYPNAAEFECKNYIFCKGSGPFTIEIIWCNETELYSPERGRCVPSGEYICPDETSTTDEISTEPVTGTEFPTSPTPYIFVCTSIGRFPNLAEPGCTTYILCAKVQNGTFISTINYCDNSYFDPVNSRCSLNYICPDNTTPMPETTDGEPTTISSDIPEDFECPWSGRFPNAAEFECKNYIVCKGSGPFIIDIIYCDATELYSPERGRCVPSEEYICPYESTTTINEDTTTQTDETSVTDEEKTSESEEPETTPSSSVTDVSTDDPTSSSEPTDVTDEETTSESSAPTIEDTTITSSDTSESEEPETTLPEDPTSAATIPTPSSAVPTSSTTLSPPVQINEEAIIEQSIGSLIDVSTYPPECMADSVIQFICPDSGRYEDKDSTDCKSYILCLRTVIGELVYAKLTCEEGTIYSDNAKTCVSTGKNSCRIQI